MDKLRNYLGLSALAMSLCLMSCNKDNTPSYSQTTMKNSELKTILQQKGYQFNEQGSLLLDDLAKHTTTLDLSGTKLSDFSELDILPHLTEVKLSSNGYSPVFDFSKLPQQITGIDLTGNPIYDYDNLINVVVEENGDETVTDLHHITKLYLPQTAKYNMENIVRFYMKNKDAVASGAIDMKMEDEHGTLQTYTTLRNVPDKNLRAYLQSNFSDLFNGDQIDLSKHLGYAQKTTQLNIQTVTPPAVEVADFEGVQYIIQNPYWEGSAFSLQPAAGVTNANIPYLKAGKYINTINLENINVPRLDLSNARELYAVVLKGVIGLSTLDLSHTLWGQRDLTIEVQQEFATRFIVVDCPSLKEIKLPEKDELKTYNLDIECLDSLETFDISNLKIVTQLTVGNLPENFNLVYPKLVFPDLPKEWGVRIDFACSESTFNRESTKAFLDKYYTQAPTAEKLVYGYYMTSKKNSGYDWRKALRTKL